MSRLTIVTLTFYQFYQEPLKVASWDLYCFWYTLMTYLSISYPQHYFYLLMIPSALRQSPPSVIAQNCLNLMNSWSIDTDLLFNLSKIFFMSFKPWLSTSYSIGSNIISKAFTHKHLGIVISSDLNWEPHHNFILAKVYKTLGLLQCSSTVNIMNFSG